SFTVSATPEIYTLSLHDALPICDPFFRHLDRALRARPGATLRGERRAAPLAAFGGRRACRAGARAGPSGADLRDCGESEGTPPRSEEHTSELQSRSDLVCRLLLE